MGQELQVAGQFPKLSMPRAIASAISDNQFSLSEWDVPTGLSRLSDEDRQRVPGLAEQAEATLAPVNGQWLKDRLSTMYLAMSNDRDADRATAWLHETIRLLADLPQDIVGQAIDEAVKKEFRF